MNRNTPGSSITESRYVGASEEFVVSSHSYPATLYKSISINTATHITTLFSFKNNISTLVIHMYIQYASVVVVGRTSRVPKICICSKLPAIHNIAGKETKMHKLTKECCDDLL